MSTATASATATNGRAPWMDYKKPDEFEPAVQALAQEYLQTLRPVNLFLKAATALIDAKPEGTYKNGDKAAYVDNAECAAHFEYFRTFMSTRSATPVLAKTSTVEEWNKLIASAVRATKSMLQGRRDARDEEARKMTVACLKTVNPKFTMTFFLDAIADACAVLAEYKDLEGDAIYLSRQVNWCAKETNVKPEGVAYKAYLAWYAQKDKGRKAAPAATTEEPAGLGDMAGEW